MKDINSALRSHRKPAKPEFDQLIVVFNFNREISYRRLIEHRLIVNIPRTECGFCTSVSESAVIGRIFFWCDCAPCSTLQYWYLYSSRLLNIMKDDDWWRFLPLLLSLPRETLKEVLPLLRSSGNPQVEYIIRALRKWAKDNRVLLS